MQLQQNLISAFTGYEIHVFSNKYFFVVVKMIFLLIKHNVVDKDCTALTSLSLKVGWKNAQVP